MCFRHIDTTTTTTHIEYVTVAINANQLLPVLSSTSSIEMYAAAAGTIFLMDLLVGGGVIMV